MWMDNAIHPEDSADLVLFAIGLANELGDDALLGSALRDAGAMGACMDQMTAWTARSEIDVLGLMVRR